MRHTQFPQNPYIDQIIPYIVNFVNKKNNECFLLKNNNNDKTHILAIKIFYS